MQKAILGVSDPTRQNALWDEAVRNHYSVRKLEELARVEVPRVPKLAHTTREKGEPAHEIETSSDIRAIESSFQHLLGTQVKVRVKADQTGEIAIQFYSLEEFERLQEILSTITT